MHFVKTGSEAEKYDFFLKASGLHNAKVDLVAVKEFWTDSVEKKDKCEESLKSKESIVSKLQDDLDALVNFDKEESKINVYKAKVFWANFYNSSLAYNELDSQLTQLNEVFNDLKSKLSVKEKESTIKGDVSAVENIIETLQNEIERINEVLGQKSEVMNRLHKNSTTVKSQISELNRTKSQFESRLKNISNEVSDAL